MCVVLYTKVGCSSTRKSLKLIKKTPLPCIVKNVSKVSITKAEVLYLLQEVSPLDMYGVISKRSIPYKLVEKEVLGWSFNKFLDYVVENPTILRTPIYVTPSGHNVGYKEGEFDDFLDREVRMYNIRKEKRKMRLKAINSLKKYEKPPKTKEERSAELWKHKSNINHWLQ